MNSQTAEPPAEEIKLELVVPDAGIRHAITKDAPDFLEIILKRKKLLTKVENFDPVEDVNDTPRMDDAKRIRLDLVKCRTGLEAIRKKLGEEARRVVDGVNEMFRGYREENESAEEFLRESEEFGARYEASRKAELAAERSPQLVALGLDPAVYNLGDMTEAQWSITLTGAKAAKEQADREAKERATQEEADRQERARLKAENDRLLEDQRRKDAEALRERQELQRKADAAAADQRVATAKLAEAEKKEELRLLGEEQLRAAEKKVAAKAARAPDKEKLVTFADALRHLKAPAVKSEEATAILLWLSQQVIHLAAELQKKAEAL